jgi:plasmid maintenance system antidote protein VapI
LKTLEEYLRELGWSTTYLARMAGINYRSAKRAVDGEEIFARTARDIALALSEATGQQIKVNDIRGLVIRH